LGLYSMTMAIETTTTNVLATDPLVAEIGDELARSWNEGGKGGKGASSSSSSSSSSGRKSFKTLSVEVVHLVSVLQRLKLLARRRGELSTNPIGRLCQSQDDASLLRSEAEAPAGVEDAEENENDERPRELARCISDPPANVLKKKRKPNWFQSLTRQKSTVHLKSGSSGRVPSGPELTRRDSLKKVSLCMCQEGDELCKRHALRALWKRYLLAFPRSYTNFKEQKKRDELDRPFLRSLLCEDVRLHQPCGSRAGKEEVLSEFQRYCEMEADIELVHNYVDEDAAVTFSEYVLASKKKNVRMCEVIHWDLSGYKSSGEAGSVVRPEMYDKGLIHGGSLPAMKRMTCFGKGMNLIRNGNAREEGSAGAAAASKTSEEMCNELQWRRQFGHKSMPEGVRDYIQALMDNDYEEIYGMLCSDFRINAFDGVKTRDTFVSWLMSLRNTSNFERTIQDIFVDHKCNTAFLHFNIRCGQKSATVVNVVQWDLEGKYIIQIREFGAGYK